MFHTESRREMPPICRGNGLPSGVVFDGAQPPQLQPAMMLAYDAGAWIWWLNSLALVVVWFSPSAGGCSATNDAVPPVVANWSRGPVFGLTHGSPLPAQSQFGSLGSLPLVQATSTFASVPK